MATQRRLPGLYPFRSIVEAGALKGRNVIYDHTFVDENYDRFEARAQELIDRKVDLMLASVAAAATTAGRLT